MSEWTGLDPEDERLQAAADLLLMRIALALINDARRAGSFGDQATLDNRLAELLDEFGPVLHDPQPPEEPAEATLIKPDQIELSVAHGDSRAVFATLRSDGILLEQGGMVGLTIELDPDTELTPTQLEQIAQTSKPHFTGQHHLRTLPTTPQPNAKTQLLAIELFEDGLLIHHTSNQDASPAQETTDAPLTWPEPTAEIKLEDDLGTDYYPSGGGGGGGVDVIYSAPAFAPAVPEQASVLRIAIDDQVTEWRL